jgi:carotenoid cleavage dioxygenase-like enzyme
MTDGMFATATTDFLRGNYAPVDREIEASGLTVRGELPKGLNGVLYRNGPNPQFPAPDSHWFVGDGMLHAITLQEGTARYRNRWVRTPKFLSEHRAGRSLYRGFTGKRPDAPDGMAGDSGVANTNVVWHAGRLLALEEGHLPTEIDPHTLETRGYRDYGVLRGAFTAHPKIDPATGEMLFFGYNAGGPFTPGLSYGVMDASGAVSRYERFDAPYASMVHDFIATDRHVLFPVLPLTGSMARAMRGQAPYAWEPDKGAYVGVLRRDRAGAEIRWFRGEACYAFHVMNAWEEGDRIVALVMAFDEPPLFPHADGSPGDPTRQQARLTRWTFDLAAGTDRFERTVIDDLTGEFPRIDERRAGLRQRDGWFACASPAFRGDGFDGLAHVDGVTGRRQAYWLPAGDAVSEPVFAPRGAAEGDGWLLAVVWRAGAMRSECLVFEARDLEAGPIATVEMPQRIPFGFHGNWVPAEALS